MFRSVNTSYAQNYLYLIHDSINLHVVLGQEVLDVRHGIVMSHVGYLQA